MSKIMKTFFKEYVPYIILICIVILIKKFIVTPIRVNGPSMNNTLQNGDIMLLNEFSYKTNGIKRFDIVVIRYKNEYLIKRVIGLPGEVVEYKDNLLYINGNVVDENFEHAETGDVEKIEVPQNEYYVLGDNRINSTDSRIIGSIPIEKIKGTTNRVIYPFKRMGKIN